jgi:hypothetical protein
LAKPLHSVIIIINFYPARMWSNKLGQGWARLRTNNKSDRTTLVKDGAPYEMF